MRAGLAFSHLISFAAGFPAALVSWSVLTAAGAVVTTGSFTPTAGAVSAVITVPAISNALTGTDLFEARELRWTYVTSGVTINDYTTYMIEAVIPFGVTPNGVRQKLAGVTALNVPDNDIGLLKAYAQFRSTVGEEELEAFESDSGFDGLVILDAIEATAALALIPSMAVRVAQKESSGTNQYTRGDVDWSLVEDQLSDMIAAGVSLVTEVETTFGSGDLLVLTNPSPDVITGA